MMDACSHAALQHALLDVSPHLVLFLDEPEEGALTSYNEKATSRDLLQMRGIQHSLVTQVSPRLQRIIDGTDLAAEHNAWFQHPHPQRQDGCQLKVQHFGQGC